MVPPVLVVGRRGEERARRAVALLAHRGGDDRRVEDAVRLAPHLVVTPGLHQRREAGCHHDDKCRREGRASAAHQPRREPGEPHAQHDRASRRPQHVCVQDPAIRARGPEPEHRDADCGTDDERRQRQPPQRTEALPPQAEERGHGERDAQQWVNHDVGEMPQRRRGRAPEVRAVQEQHDGADGEHGPGDQSLHLPLICIRSTEAGRSALQWPSGQESLCCACGADVGRLSRLQRSVKQGGLRALALGRGSARPEPAEGRYRPAPRCRPASSSGAESARKLRTASRGGG